MPSRVESAADDWLGEGFDWLDQAEDAGGDALSDGVAREVWSDPEETGAFGRPVRRSTARAYDSPGGSPAAAAVVRRRQLVALAVLCLVLVLAVVVPLVVFDNGGGGVAPITTSAIDTVTTPVAPPQTATTTTTPTTTASPTQTSPALRVTLPSSGSLRRGDRGAAVETLQKALVALGFSPGDPDGVFGQNTEAAVIDFQRSNGLQPDGVVGKETARTLNAGLANRASSG